MRELPVISEFLSTLIVRKILLRATGNILDAIYLNECLEMQGKVGGGNNWVKTYEDWRRDTWLGVDQLEECERRCARFVIKKGSAYMVVPEALDESLLGNCGGARE